MNEAKVIKNFNDTFKSSVNCIDICPWSKILVSASSDGTARIVDLDTCRLMQDPVISDP